MTRIVPKMNDWSSPQEIARRTNIAHDRVCEALREGTHYRPPIVLCFHPTSQGLNTRYSALGMFLPTTLRDHVPMPLRIGERPRIESVMRPVVRVPNTVISDVAWVPPKRKPASRIADGDRPAKAVGPTPTERARTRFARGDADVEGLVATLEGRARVDHRYPTEVLDVPVREAIAGLHPSVRLSNVLLDASLKRLSVREFVEDQDAFRRKVRAVWSCGVVTVEEVSNLLSEYLTRPLRAPMPIAPTPVMSAFSPLDLALCVVVAESQPTPPVIALLRKGALRDVTLRDYMADNAELGDELRGRYEATRVVVAQAANAVARYLAVTPSAIADFGIEALESGVDHAEWRPEGCDDEVRAKPSSDRRPGPSPKATRTVPNRRRPATAPSRVRSRAAS